VCPDSSHITKDTNSPGDKQEQKRSSRCGGGVHVIRRSTFFDPPLDLLLAKVRLLQLFHPHLS